MPVTLTYPGVYVEEIPSGVRTVTGVATSITAFLGRALRGPVNIATTINSYGDFERIFGGLWVQSSLGYAVRDFYLNGGSQAVIVRLYHAESGQNAKASKSKVTAGTVELEAVYEGKWGANLRASVDVDVSSEVAQRMGLNKEDLFNLTVRDAGPNGITERYLNVTYKNSPRRVDKVLEAESKLVRWDSKEPLDPNKLPEIEPDPKKVGDAEKKVADAEKALADAKKADPPVPADIEAAQKKLTAAQTALSAARKAISDDVSTKEDALAAARKAPSPVQADIDKAQTELDEAKKKMYDAVSNGSDLTKGDDFTPQNAEADKKGLYALEQVFARDGLFNILCIPPYLSSGDIDVSLISEAAAYCERRRAMLIVDPPSDWEDKTTAHDKFADPNTDNVGTRSRNAALFFPRLRQPNPLHDNQIEEFVPCGAVAGIFARTDTQRGVWKAPAGLDASLVGVPQLSVPLTDDENGELNPLGINCLRAFPISGRVVWGARTLRGADQLADEYKYVPVRRTALYIEESLYRGLKWVVFEPNDEPLWAQIRLNAGAFMHNLFRQGAFQGSSPRDAYFVKCDKETTTQNDINLGIVNIVVGFAPLKPAEFVVIKLQQMAGQIEA
jgi:phage tail sheath protein FI